MLRHACLALGLASGLGLFAPLAATPAEAQMIQQRPQLYRQNCGGCTYRLGRGRYDQPPCLQSCKRLRGIECVTVVTEVARSLCR